MQMNIYNSFIHNSQKLEEKNPQTAINRWTNKQTGE